MNNHAPNTYPQPTPANHTPFVADPESYYTSKQFSSDELLRMYGLDPTKSYKLSRTEEQELIHRAKFDKDTTAEAQLFTATLFRYKETFTRISNFYHNTTGMEHEDLLQGSYFGLRYAITNYNPWHSSAKYEGPHPFGPYAGKCMKGYMHRQAANAALAIHIPAYKSEEINAMYHTQGQIVQKLGRQCTISELAAATGLSEENIEKNIQIWELNRPAKFKDTVADTTTPSPERTAIAGEIRDVLHHNLDSKKLRIIEGTVIEGYKLREMGKEFKLTRERVRQIGAKSLYKLRRSESLKAQLDEPHGLKSLV